MSHDHNSEKKLEVATFAVLPMLVMLFIEMALNFYTAPSNMIFISPYLLAILVAMLISLFVFWKGQICPGQTERLTFVLRFFMLFTLGNLIYTALATPKYNPMVIVGVASILLPLFYFYWESPLLSEDDDKSLHNTLIYSSFAIIGVGILQYLAIYWVELPSLFNGIRANNFAQLLLGILLVGWYMMLAKSRLDVFFKLLVQLALLMLVMNYIWVVFVLYQQLQIMPEISLTPYLIYFVVQFVLFATLAWLLLGKGEKQIKNPMGWTIATFLAMGYPLINVV